MKSVSENPIEPFELLVIDDNLADTNLLVLLVKNENVPIQVVAHTDAERGLSYLSKLADMSGQKLPGLVVLDLSMPKLSGFEILDAIQSNPQLKHIPVIIWTSSSNPEDRLKALAHGAHDFVTKPATLEKYEEWVRKLAHDQIPELKKGKQHGTLS